MSGYWEWGIDAVVWLQSNAASLAPLMHALSFLGTTEFLLLLGLTVYWCIDTRTGVRLGLLLLGGGALGGILKLAFHMPRPYWYDTRVQPLAGETGYGMPSSHTLNAWSIAPWLGGKIRRGMGIGDRHPCGSRDLRFAHAFRRAFSRRCIGRNLDRYYGVGHRRCGNPPSWAGIWRGRDSWRNALAAVAASTVVLLSQSVILSNRNAADDPAVWAENAARINLIIPRDPNPIISLAGLILGMGIGLACKNRWAPFEAGGSLESGSCGSCSGCR